MGYKGLNSTKNLILFFTAALLWTWTAGFLPVLFNLTGTPPGTFIFYFGGGAPSAAALILVFATYPKAAVQEYFARCFSPKRAGIRGFLFPVVFFSCIAIISVTVSVYVFHLEMPRMAWIHAVIANPAVIFVILPLSFVSGPLNEEFGWRGYALDRLFFRFGFLPASFILGLIWTAWHLPWFFTPGQAQYQMLHSSLWEALLYVLFNVLLSVVVSFVYIIANRSILAGAFTHMMSNFLTSQLLAPLSSGVRSVIFGVTSLFCLGVMVFILASRRFKEQWSTQEQHIKTEMGYFSN
ncbi:MAG: CPBP family intramembrane metalloprotease [Treponema sp.]|jgi:membrane protease YdiL (CAAX protease family)|nr:CPBP family intramembrane metalloprotease [Treponema sp.]